MAIVGRLAGAGQSGGVQEREAWRNGRDGKVMNE